MLTRAAVLLLSISALAAPASAAHSPLWRAIRSGSLEAVKSLLDAGADASDPDVDPMSGTRTPMVVFAAESDSPATREIVQALLAHGAKADAVVEGGAWSGETALFRAAKRGDAPLVGDLLDRGADPNRRMPGNGHTPLMAGAVYPAVEQVLLEHGAKLNAADEFGRSAIIFAALGGCPDAVDYLRGRGARPDVADKYGKTASMYLAEFPAGSVPQGVCAPKR